MEQPWSDSLIHVRKEPDNNYHVWWYGKHLGVLITPPHLNQRGYQYDDNDPLLCQMRLDWSAEFNVTEFPEYKPPPPPERRRVSTHLGLRRPK